MNETVNQDVIIWKRLQLKRSKLKTSAKTSALLAGFAMVAMVEVGFDNEPDNPVPPFLLMIFGICTILLVSVHMLALMISICILPSIEEICRASSVRKVNPRNSPLERLNFFIEMAWIFSNVIGLFLFLVEVVILIWAKFWENGSPRGMPGKHAALAATVLLVPVLITFVCFAGHFYRQLVKYNYQRSALQLKELENIALDLKQGFPQEIPTIRPTFTSSNIITI